MVDAKYYKLFLVGSNVMLLFVGLIVLILGIKMKWALSMLFLLHIPIVLESVNAIIATGVLISMAGVTGICGACSETTGLLMGHLISLGVIVIMEFSVGVTLMIVKKTVSMEVQSPDCNNVCAASIDAAILDYALPSMGLMMTIIFVEAVMIYSCIKLYFYVRDNLKVPVPLQSANGVQNVQMHDVAGSHSPYVTTPQRRYATHFNYSPSHLQQNYVQHASGRPISPGQRIDEEKPPDYSSLQPPPLYSDSTPSAVGRSENMEPNGVHESFNQV